MRKRIFIAINLPKNIKEKLSSFEKEHMELPAKWVKPENLHITLLFLGYLKDEELIKICQKSEESLKKHASFSINLTRVCYAPAPKASGKREGNFKKPPKMVWAMGEKSEELSNLQKDLENSIFFSQVPGKVKPYAPHITLARIRQWEFGKIEPEERPEINQEISLAFNVDSIEIMESFLKRGGPEYTILESIPLLNSNN